LSIKLVRNSNSYGRSLKFGSANMRSLTPMKLDLLIHDFNVRSLDTLLLCETWHDTNSVVINRLRTDGYAVVERARPRLMRPHYGAVFDIHLFYCSL